MKECNENAAPELAKLAASAYCNRKAPPIAFLANLRLLTALADLS